MNVAAILKQKGRAVTTARPTMTLMEIANKLAAKRIGAIVIVGARGEVAGIISERDIIRALSAVGPDCLTQPISQSMTKKVVIPGHEMIDSCCAAAIPRSLEA
jgi:CBS domain-containing protein